MYNYPSNSPEDSCWLQATAQRYHARRLDDGSDRRSWPYGQVQGPDSSFQPRSLYSPYHRTVATAQPSHAHWPSFSPRTRPEGIFSSSTDSCQSVNFASCQPAVLSPVRATNFESHVCSPQRQSPNQYRTFPVPAQRSASVHSQPVQDVIPNPVQGNLYSIQNRDHLPAHLSAADLLSKDGLLVTNFAAVQSPDTGSLSSISAGRMLNFSPTETCAFTMAAQPFTLLGRGGHAQVATESDERCSSLSTHSSAPHTSAPHTYSKSEALEEDLIPYIPEVKKADVALEVHGPMRCIPDVADTSSQELVRSNSDGPCGCPRVPKSAGRKRTKIDHITVAYLEEHKCFDMPLAEAARSLDVGLSVMKRVCRTLGLARWPYRTRASLQNVIEKTQIYLVHEPWHLEQVFEAVLLVLDVYGCVQLILADELGPVCVVVVTRMLSGPTAIGFTVLTIDGIACQDSNLLDSSAYLTDPISCATRESVIRMLSQDDNSDTEDGEALSGQKADVIEALQSQMSSVTGQGSSDLKSAIKKYRQSIFKLNYKLKKNRSSPSARHKIAVPRNAAERILADQSE